MWTGKNGGGLLIGNRIVINADSNCKFDLQRVPLNSKFSYNFMLESEMKQIISAFTGAFLRGLLFVVPAAVTIYVVVRLFLFIDGLLLLTFGDTLSAYGVVPGLGIVTLVLVITLLGIIGSTIVAKPLNSSFDRVLARAPLVKTLFTAIKDLLSAFVGKEKRFDKPVLVRLGSSGLAIERIGFITRTDLSELGIGPEKVAVYLPHSYAWSGNVCIVAREQITPLAIKQSEAMKFIVSGGVSGLDTQQPLAADKRGQA